MLSPDAGVRCLVFDDIGFQEKPELADFEAAQLARRGEVTDIAVGDAEAPSDVVGAKAAVRTHGKFRCGRSDLIEHGGFLPERKGLNFAGFTLWQTLALSWPRKRREYFR